MGEADVHTVFSGPDGLVMERHRVGVIMLAVVVVIGVKLFAPPEKLVRVTPLYTPVDFDRKPFPAEESL